MPRTGASRPSESSPLLPRRTSGVAGASSSHRRASPRDVIAVSRDSSSKLSVSSAATTAAASSLSVNNSSGGVPSFGDGISSSDSLNCGNGGGSRARSEESGGSDTRAGGGGRGGASIFGSAPTSLSGFCAIFAHSVALQSWTSYVLAVGFHLFHVVLILSFLFSPILFRSTIFSSQTMAKSLLEAQGVIKHRSGSGSRGSTDKESGKTREASTSLLPSSVSQSLVAVESIWAIHDAVFFLEPGHVVVPTSIENSFGSLRHGKGHKKGDDKNRKDSKGSSDAGKGNDADADDADDADEDDNNEGGDDDGGDATHTYVVPHGGSGNKAKLMVPKTGGVAPALERAAAAAMGAKVEEVPGSKRSPRGAHVLASDVAHDSPGPLFNFAAPPPVVPQHPLSQRKSATHGRATLSKILNAWEASPLYSSPLALTLFYYLYNIGCIILLFTVTDGMLTGHFSVLRLIISLAELLWYVHHGAHAFVIYCWLVLLSHWPHHATHSPSDLDYLRFGTPYAVVEKGTGKVDMYWFYRAASGEGGSSGEGKLLQDQLDMQYYLYDQVWYLKPIASGVAVAYLILLSFCIARDLHRMLDAVVGVRVLMEPEGCVRCPLCGELMEICQQHRNARGKSMYQSARDGTSLSVRRTVWWLRWIRSAVRGSSSGHRVPTPRLRSPLWRWLLPEWLGGGPQRVADEAAREAAMNSGAASTSLEAFTTGDGPYTMADMLEDIEFYEQSAIRRSAAAPQDTMTEETAHLMRWLTVVPKSDPSVAVPVRGERSVTSSSADEEAVEALGIGSSGSSSSEDEVERGLVKAVPAGQGPTGRLPAAAARRVSTPSSRGLRSPMRRRCSGQRRRHNSTSPGSTSSSQQQQQQQQHQLAQPLPKPHRVTRFAEEVLYWNYATRHVHHRCPKLYLDAQEATDDEDDESDTDASGTTGSSSEASSSVASSVEAAAPTRGMKERRITGTLAATTTPSRAHVGDAATAASRANFADRGMRRSLSPRAHSRRDGSSAAVAAAPSAMEEQRRRQQQQQQQPALQRTMSVPITAGNRGATTASAAAAAGALYTVSGPVRSYGTIGPNFSEAPSQLFAREQPAQAAANHIVQRGVYDPTKDEEDEFRPGNAFQSFDRAGWLSRLTYSWLNPLLSFGLLEPTLLRQERFLPALPEHLLSLDNIAVPAWRLWVHRKTWYAKYVAKPGELLIPSNEAMERAEEQVMSLADLHDAETSDEGDETESSEGHQTVVMLGHTSLKQAAKFRPQRPRRSWEERLLWSVTAPLRYLLVGLFYYTYIGTSRTVRRTRRRLVRELLKDRLVAAAEDMYDENGYQAMEANEALEEATWALAEMASSCGSSAVAPSAGSALPTHMRRQLALSDVSLYHLFLEHRCGRRFLLVAAPLLLLSELLTLSLVPVLVLFVQFLQKVDTVEILPGRRQARGDEENVTYALCLAALVGVLLLLQGVAQSAYVSEVQQAAMEARTCVRAMVMEKTLALPLAQRTFSEAEVVTLATEEATRVAACLVSLHHTWSCPLRVVLLALLLGYYLGWAAAGVACVGPLFVVPWLRYAGHEKRQSLHTAKEATQPRLSLLQQALGHIREVKGMLLEGRLMRQLSKARQGEAGHAEEAAMADGTSGMLSGGVTGLLLVAALGAEFVFSEKVLRDVDVLIPTLVIFLLLTAPVLEVPALFTVVARGFLSMKRIEAYLRQTPDEFVGTWVDLTSFSAMQQQLRKENPRSALLHYRRGSVVCRDSSFTWQHDLTEESPVTLLRGVDVCIEPGQLVVVQGSMGSGKSTLLLSILGEVNRCVSAKGSDAGGGSSVTDFESESSFSVVSASEAEAAVARASVPPHGAENDSMYSHTGSNTTAHTMPFPARGSIGGADGAAAAAAAAAVAAHGIFVASPTESGIGHQHQQQRAGGDAAYSPPSTTTNATAAGRKGRDDAKPRAASTAGRKSPHTTHSSDYDGAESTAAPTEASQRAPAGLEDGESSTGGFLVFGSCAYCAEAPWLQNDTIRANIMSSGGPVQQERWYYTVLRACALSAEVAALPQGDATVVGDCGEVLSLSMRCRIAIARAVYSKSHVYLFDSVLSPLEPAMQEHIIHEVFHKLLRKRTVILASNVGLRSLRPHRVFSLVESGLVREDTQLYKAVPSLNARSDDEDEEGETEAGGESGSGSGAGDTRTRGSSHSSTSSATSQGTAAPLPPLFAEEFEEPREESDLDAPQTFDNDPMAAATTLLFDGDEDFGPRDPLFPELGDRHDGAGADMAMSSSFFYSNSAGNSGVLRPRRSGHLGPRSPTRMDPQQRSLGTSGRTSPGAITLPPPAIPFQDRGLKANGVAAAGGTPQSSTLMHDGPSVASEHGDSLESASARSAGEASSCSTGQYIRNHYAQQLERERMLRHRHRLSFFIFLRFMGSQVVWLVFTTFLYQLVLLGIDIWAAVWLAMMANAKQSDDTAAAATAAASASRLARARHQLYLWTSVTDTVFLGSVCVLTVLAMVLALLRARAVHVGVYGTMHFIYNQIVRRVLHAPASYFDSRIIALLTRVLESDAEVAEYRVPGTAEVLLSCAVQLALIAIWNAFVNPIFLLLLPVTVSLFYHISQRHAVVLREVRKLEAGSVSGMADILREVYQGASTVRCMALQDRLREEYCRALDTVNTASMVVYLADRWVELRLHLLTALAVCSAAMLGVVVTVSYSRPSLTAVAMIAALRSGPVLQTMCKTLGRFSVLEWISVQRLMSLWSVPQEPLTLEGDADLYNYSHVRRRASGFYVELEGGENAPLLDLVGTPISSPKTLAAVSEQERREEKERKRKKKRAMLSAASAAAPGGLETDASVSAAAPDSSLSAFAAPSTSSSASSSDADTAAPPRAAQQRTGDVTTITLPQLELRNVSARYRTTLPYVLRHVNLAVYPRERLGVVGHAGQGKGSLFNVLMRLVDVIEGGGVFIDGENAARVPYPVLRGWFGLIPQEPLLVHGSWRTNLLMGYHPEHRVFIESANGTDDRPYLPIATFARQQQQQQQAAAAAAGTRTTTTAALAAHLASVNEKGSPLTAGGRGAADQRNRRRRRRSSHGAASRDDSAASLPMSDSYGSTDSAQTYGEGEEPSRVRFANSMEEGDEEDTSPTGPRSSGGGALRSSLARVARRLRDKLTPFQHRSSRSGTASGRRERTPSGDAGPTRASSSGSGGGRRRRRRSSQQASSRGVSGHAVEGPRQPVEDAALWAALRAVGLDTAVEFDGGLDAPLVGGDVSEADLTESQCRLLCLARAVLNKPPIVLLEDAVLSGAEAQTDRAIRRVLANELRDATVIIIAHRMSTVLNLCTRVVAVREGTLLPIADLRSATSSAAASPQPQEGMRTNVSSTASLCDMSTPPPAAANVHPDVMRQLSYYVE